MSSFTSPRRTAAVTGIGRRRDSEFAMDPAKRVAVTIAYDCA